MRMREATIAAWQGGIVEWRAIRSKAGAVEVAGSGTIAIAAGPNGDPEPMEAMWAKIGGPQSALFCLLYPARDVLLHVMDLPAVDPDDLRAMAALQMDKLSPFPPEQAVSSAEVLGTDAESGKIRMLGATAPRARIQAVLDAAERCGRTPLRLDLDILAWWRLLRDADAVRATGSEWHLGVRDDDVWMMCCTNGLPDLLRVLAGPFTEPSALREELVYALASRGIHSRATPDRITLWGDDEEQAGRLAAALPEDLVPPATRANDELPPLVEGGARRVFAPGPGMDLVPAAWAGKQHARRHTRGLVRTVAIAAAIWLVALALAFAALGHQRVRIRRLEAEVGTLEEPAEEVRELLDRTRSLENYADRSRSAIEALREVSRLLPEGVTLTRFDYRKDRGIDLSGEAAEPEPIYEFIARVESSELFDAVRPGRIEPRRGQERVLQFPLSAHLRGAP